MKEETVVYIRMPASERPAPYIMYNVFSENAMYIAWLASDGDNDIWTINGADQVIKVTHYLKPIPLSSLLQEQAVEYGMDRN